MTQTAVLASDSGSRVLIHLCTLPIWLWILRSALAAWQGKQWRGVERYEKKYGRPSRTITGTPHHYQSPAGMGHGLIPGAAGAILTSVVDLSRMALGFDEDWWLWWSATIVAAILIMASTLYILIYFAFGVPDSWRPPPQRGWEIVDGELKKVRPTPSDEIQL